MTLEDHVVSLELAKELKENGYPQGESYFVWAFTTSAGYELIAINSVLNNELLPVDAPLASEIGEQLPNYVGTASSGGGRKGARVDYVVFENIHSFMLKDGNQNHIERAKTEADARAKMYIYLKKNGLL